MNNEVDNDFVDINKKSKYNIYIIVCILYLFVIILSILLIIGIKNQKDVIKNNINDQNIHLYNGYLNN